MDYTTNLAFFLLANTGSVCGTWQGRMTAAEQRALMGRFFGKGKLTIDGSNETITHCVKVCFGTDWDINKSATFRDLGAF